MKKRILEQYDKSPDKQKVKVYLSGIYMLLSVQLEWLDSAESLMRRHGVLCQEMKSHWNMFKKSAERLEISMRSTIPEYNKLLFLEDYEKVREILTNYIFSEPIVIDKTLENEEK